MLRVYESFLTMINMNYEDQDHENDDDEEKHDLEQNYVNDQSNKRELNTP